jgi:hypothetical protein
VAVSFLGSSTVFIEAFLGELLLAELLFGEFFSVIISGLGAFSLFFSGSYFITGSVGGRSLFCGAAGLSGSGLTGDLLFAGFIGGAA